MKEIHVAPKGKDSNTGTAGRPLRSLVGARDRIRCLRAKGQATGPVTVNVAAGVYPIDAAMRFGPGDGDVTYRGTGDVILEGGVQISRWRETEVHGVRAWVADLPAVRRGQWDFRQLFVNGKRRTRARYPKFSPSGAAQKNVLRFAEIRRAPDGSLPRPLQGDFMFKPASGDMQDWPSLYDAEIVVLHRWTEDRLTQPRFDPKTGWVECARQSVFVLNETKGETLARYYVDNLFEALTQPGEWYLDRQRGKLFYLPRRGETLETTEVIAPRVRSFINVQGVPFNREKSKGDLHGVDTVRGLRFEGLTFRHADWVQPEARMLFHDATAPCERPLASAPQGAIQVPGSISLMAAQDCAVTDCCIEHVGSYGVDVGPGCRRIELSGNRLSDLGGGGIKVHGGEVDEAGWRRTGYCSICDNTVEHGGRVFHGGIGILLGNTFENVVAHNRIRDLFYTGISVGWSWGYRETVSRENAILCNRIDTIGQGLLSDMGAIYTLGVQPGTVIAGNHVHNVLAHDYGSWGLYLDEGSSHMVVEQNLVHDTEGPCLQLHVGRENIVRNNVFVSTRGGIASIGRAEGFTSATFDHNLLVAANGLLFRGRHSTPPADGFRSDLNWILHPRGTPPHCAIHPDPHPTRLPWKTWRERGNGLCSTLRSVAPRMLPTSPQAIRKWLTTHRRDAAAFGLADPLWKSAGPRSPARRTPLWQPLWRR